MMEVERLEEEGDEDCNTDDESEQASRNRDAKDLEILERARIWLVSGN